MAHVFRFYTSMFDVTSERPNPVQPMAGESLLTWLHGALRSDIALSLPEPEDWGWQSSLFWFGSPYTLGASASDEVNGEWEWVLQIDRQRSVLELLSGDVQLANDDVCVAYLQGLLESEPCFEGMTVEFDAQ